MGESTSTESLNYQLNQTQVPSYTTSSGAPAETDDSGFWSTMKRIMGQLLESGFSGVTGSIGKFIGELIDKISDTISEIGKGISSVVSGIINAVRNQVASIIEGIQDFVGSVLDSIGSAVSDLLESVWTYIQDIIDRVVAFIDSVSSKVVELVNGFIDKVDRFIESVTSKIENLIDNIISRVYEVYQTVVDKVNDLFNETLDTIKQLASTVADKISELLDKAIETVRDTIKAIETKVAEMIDSAIETANSLIESFGESVKRVTDSIGDLTSIVGNEIAPKLAVYLEYASVPFGLVPNDRNFAEIEEANNVGNEFLNRMLDPNDNILTAVKDLVNGYNGRGVLPKFVSTLMMIMIAAVSVAPALSIIAAPRLDLMGQEVNTAKPVREYSINEAVNLASRRFIDNNRAVKAGLTQGYANDKTEKLIDASYNTLDIERGVAAYRRGFISEKEFKEICFRQGLRDTDIDSIFKLANVLPPVNDLITFAVREVFSPSIRSQFGLDQDFPTDFAKQAIQQGLTEEWARAYWAAHWRLPSANQGFEMFHRRKIDQDTLYKLLQALDYSPYWRDALKEIAYNPITRVDIRRIYKLGLMSRDEVYEAHLDLGYSPEKAELMTKFTESYVKVDNDSDDGDIVGISRTQVKRLLDLGTITRDDAVRRMQELGFNYETSTALVDSWTIEDKIKEREDLINRYIKKAIREDMDTREVETLFKDLQLTSDEMNRVKRIVAIERDEYDNIPSKTELFKMLEAGIIEYKDWFSAMRRHGYSEYWIDAYYKLTHPDKGKNDDKLS